MKYQLETIPVWDAVERHADSCIICGLMEDSLQRKVSYYLGNSVMNPETRLQVNHRGFCPEHYGMLSEEKKPQSLALMSHTRLQETVRHLQPLIRQLGSSKTPRGVRKLAKQLEAAAAQREAGCLICDALQDDLNRYEFTLVHLWGSDSEFVEAFSKSGGVCLHHLPSLVEMAPEGLSGESLREFCGYLSSQMEAWLAKAIDEVQWQTQMYKSESAGKDWRGCQEAHKRAVRREIGRARIHDQG